MKQAIKIILTGLISLILILVVGGIVFVKTYDFNRLKPQMITSLEKTLNRKVDFSKIGLELSFQNGVTLSVKDIAIGEHPDFGKDDCVRIKELNLSVSIKDLLLKRQITVLGLDCAAPSIVIVKLKDGRINLQAAGGVLASQVQTNEASKQSKPSMPSTTSMPAFIVNYIRVNNAQIHYIDRSFEPNISFIIDDLTFNAEKITLTGSFPISLSASFAGSGKNLNAQGRAEMDVNRQSILLKDITGESDLSLLSMDKLRRFVPQLKDIAVEIKSGTLSLAIKECRLGSPGLVSLDGKGSIRKGSLTAKGLVAPLSSMEADFTLSESDFILDKASCLIGKASAILSGNIRDYLKNQDYALNASLEGFDVNECVEQSAYPIKVKGILDGKFNFSGRSFDPNTAFKQLSGNGSIDIKEGQLTDINVLKMVLEKLAFVPNLAATLEANLPENLKESLRKKDTVVTRFKTDVGLNNSLITFSSLDMQAQPFSFQGRGTMSMDQQYMLDGAFVIPQEASSQMAAVVKELEYLFDQSKQIRFPLRVSGKGSSVSFVPDVKQIGVNAIKQKGFQELEKILEKTLNKNDPEQDKKESVPQ